MEEKKTSLMYRIIRFLVWLFYRRPTIVGAEKLPDDACVIVGNHTQMNGPIVAEIYLPGKPSVWCAGEMMHRKEVAAYAFTDFWSFKPKWTHPFYRVLAWLITPLSVCIFNNARTIPVYHDARLRTTLRESLEKLERGTSLVIFPERNEPYNHILYDFQDRFIDLARMHYRRTGKVLSFVPMYVAPALRETHFGDPIRFDPEAPFDEERTRIKRELMEAITAMAEALPAHTVVPYRNIPRRCYPKNRPDAVVRKIRPPVVDYRSFRFSRLNDPQFSHIKLLLGWVGYFTLYFLTENLIPPERCHPVYCALDDLVPFCEGFVVFYTSWFALIVFSLLVFFLYDIQSFRDLSGFIIITQIVAMAVYIIWPSRQDLRPETFPRENVFTWVIGFLYSFDTPTGVCPSLHVAYSLGIGSVWLKKKDASPLWKVVLVLWLTLICLSVMFVKQHSAVDVIAALPLGLLAELIIFRKRYFGQKKT